MSIKKDIVRGVRWFWGILIIFAIIIGGRIFQLQLKDISKLGAEAVKVTVEKRKFLAVRGEIYAENDYLLACSLPFFNVYMDLVAPPITDSIFNAGVEPLASSLASLFEDKNPKEYLVELKKARKQGKKYYRLGNRRISYMEAEQVKKFPIFNKGRYKGGLILEEEIRRYRPFGMLGERTLGKVKNTGGKKVGSFGLEDAYESELKGVEGERKIIKAPRRYTDFIVKEPIEGDDVYTTLDVDIQDLAESVLRSQLQEFKAHHGTVVVMEVATGAIRAIANLELASDGYYYERRNHAIADAVEPGSVFKLPSMIALLEDGKVKLADTINTGYSGKKFYGATMRDYHAVGKVTVQEVFEKSSNVGISMMVHDAYKENPQKYIDRLYDLHLGEPLGLKIKGEGKPYIKDPKSTAWWGTSLPWMSVGYEVNITALQMLTLYNAVANNGVMVKPRLVSAIKHNGRMVRDFSKPIVMDNNICSQATLKKIQSMLEGVVERGTARNIKDDRYKIAGKTGTAHIAQVGGGYDNTNYRATFIGYYPADKPKYSTVVVIEKPDRSIGRFGGSVAGPVFKKVADELYAKGLLFDAKELDSIVDKTQKKIGWLAGVSEPTVLKSHFGSELKTKVVLAENRKIMPNVVGMSLDDAVFLLESLGMEVKLRGQGAIRKQSVAEGVKLKSNSKVILTLL